MKENNFKKVRGNGKRMAIVALALVLSLSALTGCSTNKKATDAKDTPAQSQQKDTTSGKATLFWTVF